MFFAKIALRNAFFIKLIKKTFRNFFVKIALQNVFFIKLIKKNVSQRFLSI